MDRLSNEVNCHRKNRKQTGYVDEEGRYLEEKGNGDMGCGVGVMGKQGKEM